MNTLIKKCWSPRFIEGYFRIPLEGSHNSQCLLFDTGGMRVCLINWWSKIHSVISMCVYVFAVGLQFQKRRKKWPTKRIASSPLCKGVWISEFHFRITLDKVPIFSWWIWSYTGHCHPGSMPVSVADSAGVCSEADTPTFSEAICSSLWWIIGLRYLGASRGSQAQACLPVQRIQVVSSHFNGRCNLELRVCNAYGF